MVFSALPTVVGTGEDRCLSGWGRSLLWLQLDWLSALPQTDDQFLLRRRLLLQFFYRSVEFSQHPLLGGHVSDVLV